MRTRRGSGNVFRDLGFPEGEAHTLALRSELMIGIEQVVTRTRLTRAAVAKRLGIAQPRLNALLQGKLDQFDLDALVAIAASAGLRVELGIVRQRAHEAIQAAFGWEDRHLHEFQVGSLRLGVPDTDEESSDLHDDTEWTLREVLKTATKEFLYVYDFGDQWEHRIVIEPEFCTGAERLLAPLCRAGENAAPPEDAEGRRATRNSSRHSPIRDG